MFASAFEVQAATTREELIHMYQSRRLQEVNIAREVPWNLGPWPAHCTSIWARLSCSIGLSRHACMHCCESGSIDLKPALLQDPGSFSNSRNLPCPFNFVMPQAGSVSSIMLSFATVSRDKHFTAPRGLLLSRDRECFGAHMLF